MVKKRYNWKQTYHRVCQLASVLKQYGIGEGDTVSIMGYNTPKPTRHILDSDDGRRYSCHQY